MARINLLPWRVERRRLRQREFGVMAMFAAFAGVVLWLLVNTYYNHQIDGQNERNAYLQDQIKQVDIHITEIDALDRQRSRLLARKEVIEQLQANRSQMVRLFDSLGRTIPDGVVLTSIKQEGQQLTLNGRSQSNARVSTYLRNLEGSGWMIKPDLSIIEASGGVSGLPYTFTLRVTLVNPNAARDESVPAAAPPVGGAPAQDAARGETAPPARSSAASAEQRAAS